MDFQGFVIPEVHCNTLDRMMQCLLECPPPPLAAAPKSHLALNVLIILASTGSSPLSFMSSWRSLGVGGGAGGGTKNGLTGPAF